jgi:hypothetical protein
MGLKDQVVWNIILLDYLNGIIIKKERKIVNTLYFITIAAIIKFMAEASRINNQKVTDENLMILGAYIIIMKVL